MFKALYRKYRPTSFDDVVGQHHAVTVLQKAIEKNKIAHAYIFYGPRGTGKTSIAKIFASEANKIEYSNDSVDIIEIDAASNNGVDEIRELKEAIKFAPTENKYKVYIVDEVHMLTPAAFNALLKTLEEPPSHVIFILATTEIHKVPATILSRCQKFEFKNLTEEQLISRLKFISQQENISIEDEALQKIAKLAKGGLRDAIGILDQVSNYVLEKISISDVLDITSSLGEETITDFYKLILQKNANEALIKYNEFISVGKDSKIILSNLISLTRDIIIFKNMSSTEFCEFDLTNINDEINQINNEELYRNIDILSNVEQNIRFSQDQVSYMQIGIIKMCSPEDKLEFERVQQIDSTSTNMIKILEQKISQLENKLLDLQVNTKDNISSEKNKDISLSKDSQLIIPNKKDILELIELQNDKFTKYISDIFDFILNRVIKENDYAYSVFKESKIIASSRNAGLILFNNQEDIIKANSNQKYKAYIENYISKKIDVEYKVFYLQRLQFEQLLNEYEKKNQEDKIIENNIDEKKTSKIESLFSDIIVESPDSTQ